MALRPALLGAVAGTAVSLSILTALKIRALKRAQEQAEAPRPTAVLGPAVRGLRARLETYARAETERLADAAAERTLSEVYGLTPRRIQGLSRLARLVGA